MNYLRKKILLAQTDFFTAVRPPFSLSSLRALSEDPKQLLLNDSLLLIHKANYKTSHIVQFSKCCQIFRCIFMVY